MNERQEREYVLEREIEELKAALANERAKLAIAMEALEGCERNDKSEPYAYGDNTLGRRRDGKAPDAGKRWNVPREIAERALARINELEKQS